MKLRVLTIPLLGTDSNDQLEALQHQWEITRYEHYLVDLAEGPAIAVVAALRDRPPEAEAQHKSSRTSRAQLVAALDPLGRDRFEQLRAWRKSTARDEGLPVYALATNAQLAEIASLSNPSRTKLSDIGGFGRKKVDRYADSILGLLSGAGTGEPRYTENNNDDATKNKREVRDE